MINMPLISIITVSYNNQDGLEQTIQSIINQTYKNIEYIIIDGGSTDGTVEIIKKYEDNIEFWTSESDNGIFDAMNKGLSHAHGEWVHYLNSSDVYFSHTTLENVAPYIQDNNKYDIIHGLMATKRPDGSLKKINSAQFLPQVALYRDCPIQQPAAFLRYTTLWNYRFDTALRIASDYKLWVNMLLNGVRARFVNQIITLFAPAGISSNLDERNEEVIQIFRDIGMPKILIVLSHFKMFVAAWLRRHIKR